MNSPQNIIDKFLLPAGYLPPLVPASEFHTYEDLRTGKFAGGIPIAAGFEYYFMRPQDPEVVNKSVIGGKIFGVHGPWTKLKYAHDIPHFILTRTVMHDVAPDLLGSALTTIKFAKDIGAKYTVFHAADLDESQPEKFVEKMTQAGKESGVAVYLEPDAPAYIKNYRSGEMPVWFYDPVELYKKFGLPVVFDPASIEPWQDIKVCWERLEKLTDGDLMKVVGHVHLNEYRPKLERDQGVLCSPKYADLIKTIFESRYSGFYTFEISPMQNFRDNIEAAIFGAAAFTGIASLFPALYRWYAAKAQYYLYKSQVFALNSLNS